MALQRLAKSWPEISTLHETDAPVAFEFSPADVLMAMDIARKEGDLCTGSCPYRGQCQPDECLLLVDPSN